jgi:hypothetical protein
MSGLRIGDRVEYNSEPYLFMREQGDKYVLGRSSGEGIIANKSKVKIIPKKVQKFSSGQTVTYNTVMGTKRGTISNVRNTNSSFVYIMNNGSSVPQNRIIGGKRQRHKASRRHRSRKQRRYTRRR